MKKISIAIIALLLFSSSNEGESPRDMNGKTELRTGDSVYYITFKIDSVIEREYEPEDRRP